MGINSQPNNRNWGRRDNIAIAKEAYEHDEFNALSTTDSPSVECPSLNYNPYEDSDVGDSLRETREMGRHKRINPDVVAKVVGAISITTITAVTLVSNIAQTKPVLEDMSLTMSQSSRLDYEFSLTTGKNVTAFVDLTVDWKRQEEHVYHLDIASEEAEALEGKKWKFTLSGLFEDLPAGYYEFRVYCQFGFGKSSIYSKRGTIGGEI